MVNTIKAISMTAPVAAMAAMTGKVKIWEPGSPPTAGVVTEVVGRGGLVVEVSGPVTGQSARGEE